MPREPLVAAGKVLLSVLAEGDASVLLLCCYLVSVVEFREDGACALTRYLVLGHQLLRSWPKASRSKGLIAVR